VTLQRRRTPEAYEEVLGELGEEVDSMTELVDRLLRLARGAPTKSAAVPHCDVQEILDDVVRSTAAIARSRGDTVHLTPATRLLALANPAEVRQIFLNLVANALQHTPVGTTVNLAGQSRDGVVEVTVSDNGPGIPKEDQETVFEPFHRLEGTSATGAGLGLALCRELVLANGGSIVLDANTERGATFRVRLQRAP
jgi:signal transduction histidine kinase